MHCGTGARSKAAVPCRYRSELRMSPRRAPGRMVLSWAMYSRPLVRMMRQPAARSRMQKSTSLKAIANRSRNLLAQGSSRRIARQFAVTQDMPCSRQARLKWPPIPRGSPSRMSSRHAPRADGDPCDGSLQAGLGVAANRTAWSCIGCPMQRLLYIGTLVIVLLGSFLLTLWGTGTGPSNSEDTYPVSKASELT